MSEYRMIIKKFNVEVLIASIYLAITGIINTIALFWLFIMFVWDSYDEIMLCIIMVYTVCTAIYIAYIVKLIKSQIQHNNIIQCLQKKLVSRHTLKLFLITKDILVLVVAALALITGENAIIFAIIPVTTTIITIVISNYYIKLNIEYLAVLIDEHKKLLTGER